jgi:hypothetical protein
VRIAAFTKDRAFEPDRDFDRLDARLSVLKLVLLERLSTASRNRTHQLQMPIAHLRHALGHTLVRDRTRVGLDLVESRSPVVALRRLRDRAS